MKQFLYTFRIAKFNFKEKRLIGEGPLENLWDAGGNVVEAGSEIGKAAAELIKVATGALKGGINLLQDGFAETKDGVKNIIEWWKDPGDPEDLPEYEEMGKYFDTIPGESDNENVEAVVDLHRRIEFLKIKMTELTKFYEIGLTEYERVESALNAIKIKKRLNKERVDQLKDQIKRNEGILSTGRLLNGDQRRIEIELQTRSFKQELASLDAENSEVVMWYEPQVVKIEFPVGSGNFEDRFVLGDKKVKVDLNALYRYLKVYVGSSFEPKFKKYQSEIDKLAYAKQQGIDGLDFKESASALTFASKVNTQSSAAIEIVKKMTFTTKEKPKPILHTIREDFKIPDKNINKPKSRHYKDVWGYK